MGVICERVREAISAQLDGEPGPTTAGAVDEHLNACPSCSAWQEQAVALHRRTRLVAAPAVPDLAERISAALPTAGAGTPADRSRRWPARVVLAALGAAQLAIAVPALLLGHDHHAPMHIAHEAGSFSVAVAAGLVVAAWRPRLAAGMVPIVGLIAGLLLVTAGVDLSSGRTDLGEEAPHLLELASFLLLWWLSATTRERGGSAPALRPARRGGGPSAGWHGEAAGWSRTGTGGAVPGTSARHELPPAVGH